MGFTIEYFPFLFDFNNCVITWVYLLFTKGKYICMFFKKAFSEYELIQREC